MVQGPLSMQALECGHCQGVLINHLRYCIIIYLGLDQCPRCRLVDVATLAITSTNFMVRNTPLSPNNVENSSSVSSPVPSLHLQLCNTHTSDRIDRRGSFWT